MYFKCREGLRSPGDGKGGGGGGLYDSTLIDPRAQAKSHEDDRSWLVSTPCVDWETGINCYEYGFIGEHHRRDN